MRRVVSQKMKVVGEDRAERSLLEVKGQLAEREERCDDAGDIARDRDIKIISRMNEWKRLAMRRKIAAAIAQFVKVPVASHVRRTQISELSVDIALHRQHVCPKVAWEKVQSFVVWHQRRHDRVLFSV